ncbi:MAG: hypothetical protein KDA89_18620 [Planctomycetaceae bacterium]|nr:hypothetical protein [Planctomycetaceae bacterium]
MVAKRRNESGTKSPPKTSGTDRFPLIEKALRKRTKADIIDLTLTLAKEHPAVARDLEHELAIEKPVDLLSADVSSAIGRATDFDERMMNYNFAVDWQAYEDVRTGLGKLIELGQLEDAKTLALKLMKNGSYQVECSDEGLMTDDIESCLKLVINAVKTDENAGASQWAAEMLRADRVGFICDQELKRLAEL